MFGLFKKRQSPPTAAELSALAASALVEVKDKWVFFNQTIHFASEVSLAEKIDLFVQPVQEFFEKKYSVLLLGSYEMFWLTVFTAIPQSGTHPKEEVNLAISELRKKYAGAR